MNSRIQVYLASASPRRRILLQQIGVSFRAVPVDVDESMGRHESVEDYVVRVALAKARAAAHVISSRDEVPVLGADTVVWVDGEIFGKPSGRKDGLAMLERLSGRAHQVLSGVAIVGQGLWETRLSRTTVWFRPLSVGERIAYWDTGEPADKAGAYAIQGLAAAFISRLDGSYSGVMGLPLFETVDLLSCFRISAIGPG
jgi:septum formation protein